MKLKNILLAVLLAFIGRNYAWEQHKNTLAEKERTELAIKHIAYIHALRSALYAAKARLMVYNSQRDKFLINRINSALKLNWNREQP